MKLESNSCGCGRCGSSDALTKKWYDYDNLKNYFQMSMIFAFKKSGVDPEERYFSFINDYEAFHHQLNLIREIRPFDKIITPRVKEELLQGERFNIYSKLMSGESTDREKEVNRLRTFIKKCEKKGIPTDYLKKIINFHNEDKERKIEIEDVEKYTNLYKKINPKVDKVMKGLYGFTLENLI